MKTNGRGFDWEAYAQRGVFVRGNQLAAAESRELIKFSSQRELSQQIGVVQNTFKDAMLILRYAPTAAKKVKAGGMSEAEYRSVDNKIRYAARLPLNKGNQPVLKAGSMSEKEYARIHGRIYWFEHGDSARLQNSP